QLGIFGAQHRLADGKPGQRPVLGFVGHSHRASSTVGVAGNRGLNPVRQGLWRVAMRRRHICCAKPVRCYTRTDLALDIAATLSRALGGRKGFGWVTGSGKPGAPTPCMTGARRGGPRGVAGRLTATRVATVLARAAGRMLRLISAPTTAGFWSRVRPATRS